MTTGLVLAGGGVNGAFEAGAIECLVTEYFAKFNVIAGSSTGALVGAFALLEEYQMMNDVYRDSKTADILNDRHIIEQFYTDGFFDSSPLSYLIHQYIDVDKAVSLWPAKKLIVKTTNLRTGAKVNFTNNPKHKDVLHKALLASASIPVFMDPVEINGDLYVDAGVRDMVPLSDVLNEGCDRVYVITADTGTPGELEKNPKGKIDIALRSISISLTEAINADIKEGGLLNELVGLDSIPYIPGIVTLPPKKAEIFYIMPMIRYDGDALDFDSDRTSMWRDGYIRTSQIIHEFYGRTFSG